MTAHTFRWQMPVDHPALPGHFPNQPIAPGVVLLDQLTLCAMQINGNPESLWQLANVKFLESALGGDHLVFVLREKESAHFDFEIQRDDQLIAKGALKAMPNLSAGTLTP